jgi:hypothetical protein
MPNAASFWRFSLPSEKLDKQIACSGFYFQTLDVLFFLAFVVVAFGFQL